MTEEGVVVSKTVRGPLESQVVRVPSKQGETFMSQVLWQGEVLQKDGPFYEQDEAEAKADQMRDKVFREKYAVKK